MWKLTSQHQYRYIVRCSYSLLAVCTLLLQATASQFDRGGPNVKLHVTDSMVEVARGFESNENSCSSSFGNWLLIFGHIHKEKGETCYNDGMLGIAVEINEHIWKEQLRTSTYAFRAPVNCFAGMIGMIYIYQGGETTRSTKNLWRKFFIIQDVGVLQLDAILSENCTKASNAGTEVMPWIISTCLPRNTVENFVILHLAMRLQSATSMICPLLINKNICVIEGAIVTYPAEQTWQSVYKRLTLQIFRFIFLSITLRSTEDCSGLHRMFGVRLLRTWHLNCLAAAFLFLQFVNWLLRSLETIVTDLSKLERQVAIIDGPSQELLSWELLTSCPSSSDSSQGLKHSGDGSFQEPWSSAHQYRSNRLDSPMEPSFIYYNYTDQHQSSSTIVLPSGGWSRDRNGRLFRGASS